MTDLDRYSNVEASRTSSIGSLRLPEFDRRSCSAA